MKYTLSFLRFFVTLAIISFASCTSCPDIEYSISSYEEFSLNSESDSFEIIQPIVEETGISLSEFRAMDDPWYEQYINTPRVNELSNGINLAIVDNGDGDHDPECLGKTRISKNATGEIGPGNHHFHCRGIAGGVNVGLEREQMSFGGYKALRMSGSGSSLDIVQACQWAIGDDYKVISLSLGGSRPFPSLEKVIQENPNVLFVCAAGNSSHSQVDADGNFVQTTGWPANYAETYDNVISVGSLDGRISLRPSSFTSRGPVTISAPGSFICSSITNNEYAVYSGTSMATPYVSSAASMFWEIFPKATAASIKKTIEETATKIDYGEDLVGAGLIDFVTLLEKAHDLNKGVVPPPVVEPEPEPEPSLCEELTFGSWRIESVGNSRKTFDFTSTISVRDQEKMINRAVYEMDKNYRNKYWYSKPVKRSGAPDDEIKSVRDFPVWIIRDQRGTVCHTQVLMEFHLAGKR